MQIYNDKCSILPQRHSHLPEDVIFVGSKGFRGGIFKELMIHRHNTCTEGCAAPLSRHIGHRKGVIA